MPAIALASRAFLGRAVGFLAAEAGIRQFIDIGTGIPSAGNVHEVGGRAAPDTWLVYVDNDPNVWLDMVLAVVSVMCQSAPGTTP